MTSQQHAPGAAQSSTSQSADQEKTSTALLEAKPESERTGYSTLGLWMHRIAVLLFVFLCAVMGMLLIILPWWPQWTDNRFLLAYPGLRMAFASGFVRGLCSGLGILDVWIGFWEAIHYHEDNYVA